MLIIIYGIQLLCVIMVVFGYFKYQQNNDKFKSRTNSQYMQLFSWVEMIYQENKVLKNHIINLRQDNLSQYTNLRNRIGDLKIKPTKCNKCYDYFKKSAMDRLTCRKYPICHDCSRQFTEYNFDKSDGHFYKKYHCNGCNTDHKVRLVVEQEQVEWD